MKLTFLLSIDDLFSAPGTQLHCQPPVPRGDRASPAGTVARAPAGRVRPVGRRFAARAHAGDIAVHVLVVDQVAAGSRERVAPVRSGPHN